MTSFFARDSCAERENRCWREREGSDGNPPVFLFVSPVCSRKLLWVVDWGLGSAHELGHHIYIYVYICVCVCICIKKIYIYIHMIIYVIMNTHIGIQYDIRSIVGIFTAF